MPLVYVVHVAVLQQLAVFAQCDAVFRLRLLCHGDVLLECLARSEGDVALIIVVAVAVGDREGVGLLALYHLDGVGTVGSGGSLV